MFNLKRIVGLVCLACVPALVGVVGAGPASAADETINLRTVVVPAHGKVFKRRSVPAKMQLSATVNTPASSLKVNPLKRAIIQFPKGLTFHPNNRKTPVCSDKALSETSNLAAGPAGIVELCPKSVIGTGTAKIYLAKVHEDSALVSDPQLVIFNAGVAKGGLAKMKIYAYSRTTNVGILMHGTVSKKGIINVFIPVLSNDSAVKYFQLNIPGGQLDREDINVHVHGLDPNYVQAKCASSPLKTNAVFELGERSYPSGTPTGPTTTVTSPQTTQDCVGKAGTPKLGFNKVNGPSAVKNGKTGSYKVTIKNPGTATVKNVVVTNNRGGKTKAGNIAPGKTKTVSVKAKIKGKKGKKVAVKFTAKAGNVKASTTKQVKVK